MTKPKMKQPKPLSKYLEEFEKEFIVKRPDGTYRWLRGIWQEDIEAFITKMYKELR